MSRKVKQILCAMGLVCLISIVCNVLLLVKKGDTPIGNQNYETKIDSLENEYQKLIPYQNAINSIMDDTTARKACQKYLEKEKIQLQK